MSELSALEYGQLGLLSGIMCVLGVIATHIIGRTLVLKLIILLSVIAALLSLFQMVNVWFGGEPA